MKLWIGIANIPGSARVKWIFMDNLLKNITVSDSHLLITEPLQFFMSDHPSRVYFPTRNTHYFADKKVRKVKFINLVRTEH